MAATRRARSACRSPRVSSASSEAASTARRTSGSVSPASSCSNTCASPSSAASTRLRDARRVSTSIRQLAARRLRAAPRAAAGARPAGRRRTPRCRAARAASRGRRPVRPPRARARDTRRPPAAARAARRPSPRTADIADLGIGLRPARHQVTGDQPAVPVTGHQRARRLPVQPLALGPGEVLGDRDRDQAVREALTAVGQQAGGHQRVARRAELAERHARHGGDDVRRGAVADHRQRLDHLAVARAELGQAPAYDGARRSASTGGASWPGASIAPGPCPAICRPSSPSSHGLPPTARWQSRQHGQRRLRREPADQLHRAARRQRLGVQHGRRADRAEQAQQVRGRVGIVGARGDEDQQRQVLDAPRQVGQHLQARSGRPTARRRRPGPAAAARRAPSTPTARCGRSARSSRRAGAVPSRSSSPAVAAAPSSRCARSEPDASRSGASSSARTTPKGKWRSSGPGAARRTRHPAAVASSAPCSSSAVLPRPGGGVDDDDAAAARRPAGRRRRAELRARRRARSAATELMATRRRADSTCQRTR